MRKLLFIVEIAEHCHYCLLTVFCFRNKDHSLYYKNGTIQYNRSLMNKTDITQFNKSSVKLVGLRESY